MRNKSAYSKDGPPIGPDDASDDDKPGAKQTVVRTALWSPGAKPAAAAASVFDLAKKTTDASKRVKLPPLDLAMVVVKRGVEKPPVTGRYCKDGGRYKAVFDQLTAVGMSLEAPVAYIGSLKTHARKLKKTGRGVFSVHRLNPTTCGVWRDE